jgi:hypothetical protein
MNQTSFIDRRELTLTVTMSVAEGAALAQLMKPSFLDEIAKNLPDEDEAYRARSAIYAIADELGRFGHHPN